MDYCWFFTCCTTTHPSTKKAFGNSNALSDRTVRTQPQLVGSMRIYEELDASYAPKVEDDFRQIKKGMEVAPREVVQRALGIETQIPMASISEQGKTSVQQLDSLENRLKQAGFREAEPADDDDSDSDSTNSDYDGSDSATDAGDLEHVDTSQELFDGDSVVEIVTAQQVSMTQIQAARLAPPENPEGENLFIIYEEKDEASDSDNVSHASNEHSADHVQATVTIRDDAVTPNAEFRGLPDEEPETTTQE